MWMEAHMSESDSSNALPLAKVREPPPALTRYRSLRVAGWLVFYREAGPKDASAILLLHGFPSSSRMFEPLLKRLADSYHLIAPDYIGFGHSEAPPPAEFEYTFGRRGQAEIQIELFCDYRTNVASYSIWQDWLKRTQPHALIVWGKYDASFD